MFKGEAKRRTLNYMALFVLIFFNGVLLGFLVYIGTNLINNTKKSHILEVSQDVQNNISGQTR